MKISLERKRFKEACFICFKENHRCYVLTFENRPSCTRLDTLVPILKLMYVLQHQYLLNGEAVSDFWSSPWFKANKFQIQNISVGFIHSKKFICSGPNEIRKTHS